MDVPGIVDDALEGEDVAADVDLGGDDHLYVTPTRTLIYRSEGILSDESVEAYDHEAERLSVSEGRRKTKCTLTYPIEGTEEFSLPAKSAEDAIPAILAGILHANGVLEPGESVLETFRFSELTLVVTSDRLVEHVGGAVWDVEYEEFAYDDVTGLSEEAGSVATQLVLDVAGRSERIKTPNDRAPEVRQRLEDALRAFHDLGERDDLHAALAAGADDAEDADSDAGSAAAGGAGGGMTFEDGVDPLDAGDTRDVGGEELAGVGTSDRGDVGRAASGSSGASDSSGSGGAGDSSGSSSAGDSSGSGGASAASDAGSARSTGSRDENGPSGSGHGERPQSERARSGNESGEEGDASAGRAGSAPVESGASPAAEPGGGTEAATGAGAAGGTDGAASGSASGAETDDDPLEDAGFESATDSTPGIEAELEELRDAVEQQNELLARQQETIEQLVEELRRGR